MRAITLGVLAAATLGTAGFVLSQADRSTLPLIVLTTVFALWAVSPYALLWAAAARWTNGTGPAALVLGASVAIGAFGLWIYYQGFYVAPDPQSGLLFLFIPFWQWIGAGTAVTAAAIWSAAHQRADAPPA